MAWSCVYWPPEAWWLDSGEVRASLDAVYVAHDVGQNLTVFYGPDKMKTEWEGGWVFASERGCLRTHRAEIKERSSMPGCGMEGVGTGRSQESSEW